MSNVNLTTAITIQATNIAAGTTPFNLALNGILLPITVWNSSDFFQVQLGATIIPLPASTIYYAFIINLGPNPVTLAVEYNPASLGSEVLSPVNSGFGGLFAYMQTDETHGGITAITATTVSTVNPIQYFVAA